MSSLLLRFRFFIIRYCVINCFYSGRNIILIWIQSRFRSIPWCWIALTILKLRKFPILCSWVIMFKSLLILTHRLKLFILIVLAFWLSTQGLLLLLDWFWSVVWSALMLSLCIWCILSYFKRFKRIYHIIWNFVRQILIWSFSWLWLFYILLLKLFLASRLQLFTVYLIL